MNNTGRDSGDTDFVAGESSRGCSPTFLAGFSKPFPLSLAFT